MADPAFVIAPNATDDQFAAEQALARQRQYAALAGGAARLSINADVRAAQREENERSRTAPVEEPLAKTIPGRMAFSAMSGLGEVAQLGANVTAAVSGNPQADKYAANLAKVLQARQDTYDASRRTLNAGVVPTSDYAALTGAVLNPFAMGNLLKLKGAALGAAYGLKQGLLAPTTNDENYLLTKGLTTAGSTALGATGFPLARATPDYYGYGAKRAGSSAATEALRVAQMLESRQLPIAARADAEHRNLARNLADYEMDVTRLTPLPTRATYTPPGSPQAVGDRLTADAMNARADLEAQRGTAYRREMNTLTNAAGTGLVNRAEQAGNAVGDTQAARDFVQMHRDLLTPDPARTPEVTPTSAAPLTAISTRIVRAFDTNTVDLTAAEAAEATANGFRVASRPGPDVTVYHRVGKYPGDPLEEITADQARGLGPAQVQTSTRPGDPIYSRTFKNSYEALEQLSRQFGDQFDADVRGGGAAGVIAGRNAATGLNRVLDEYVTNLGGSRQVLRDIWREGTERLARFDEQPLGRKLMGEDALAMNAADAIRTRGITGVREYRDMVGGGGALEAVQQMVATALAPKNGVPLTQQEALAALEQAGLPDILAGLPGVLGLRGAHLQREVETHLARVAAADVTRTSLETATGAIPGAKTATATALAEKTAEEAHLGGIRALMADLQRGSTSAETLSAADKLLTQGRPFMPPDIYEGFAKTLAEAVRLKANAARGPRHLRRAVWWGGGGALLAAGTNQIINPKP